MDLTDPTQREEWRRHLSTVLAGRKVICGVAPLAAMNELVVLVDRAGAQKPLLVHSSRGAGPVPTDDDAVLVEVESPDYATMSEEVRDQDRLARTLPGHVRAQLDAYDPEREAVWFAGPFIGTEPIDGRAVLGGRPRAWAALEDKTLVDELWDAVGYPRSPSRVVDVTSEALDAASRDLDLGSGTVWVADSRDGLNGGGEFTRWTVTAEERAEALDFLRPRCDRVRVMPFLDGVPCSIHGIVLRAGTAAFRPVELAILRGEGRRFVYGGQGTYWDPPQEDRDRMRELVRRSGALLSERFGYRGCFGIDGILTADGFRPTELNPRFAAGLVTLAQGVDLELFHLLQTNLVLGRDTGVTAAELEVWALPQLDAHRVLQPRAVADRRVAEDSVELRLTWDGERLRHDPEGSVRLLVGPNPKGAFARLDLSDPDAIGVGDRLAPLNAAMMRFLDDEFDAGFGPVEPAPDVRRSLVDVRRSDHQQRDDDHGDVGEDLADAHLLRAEPTPR